MNMIVADQRVLRGSAAVLSFQYVDGDGEPADPGGAVTVGVTKADGTVVIAAGTATTGTGTDARTYTLPAASNATLEELVTTWTVAGIGAFVTRVEVVDAFFFSVAEARNSDATLRDREKYPAGDIIATRVEVEDECQEICDRSFVRRYRRATLDGTGSGELFLPDAEIRAIRSIRTYSSASTYTAFTDAQLADVAYGVDPKITLPAGRVFDDQRAGNIVIEYEFGWDRPPSDLKRASLTRLRHRLNFNKSGIPDRATSFSVAEGGTFQLDVPDMYKTGIPDVDAAYSRYSRRRSGVTGGVAPASRSLDMDPQRFSLFHGPRR